MPKYEFHKSEKGQGDEHWYSLCVDDQSGAIVVEDSWSLAAGRGNFKDGSRTYSLEQFALERPNTNKHLISWLCSKLARPD